VEGLVPGHVDERVVVHGVDLSLDHLRRGPDHLDLRAQPLGRGPEGVAVLLGLLERVQLVDLLGRLDDGAPFEDVLHYGGGLDLARVVLELVGQVVRELGLPEHGFGEDGGHDLGEYGQEVGLEEDHGGQARAHGGAVH
ncbi:hypothetical protein TorRG33x02_263040, partial [Trema orientale]